MTMALKLSQLKEMGFPEAEERLAEIRAELAKERALVASHTKQENPGKIRALRRTVARILTIINEKKKRESKKVKTSLKEVK
jgi:large subunit ribosomal protein L29